jgi:hypothetical protein
MDAKNNPAAPSSAKTISPIRADGQVAVENTDARSK